VIPALCAVLALVEVARLVVGFRAASAARREARFAEVVARVAVRS
jgi:hypothetical protein